MGIIHLGEGNTSGVMSPLVPFNCVFDTDFGLLTLIDRNYLDKSVFSVDFFNNNHSIRKMILSLVEREKENPLTICTLPDINDLDSLYKEFISKKYKEILELSMPTEVYNVLELFKLSGDIKPTIICESEIEDEFLNKFTVTKNIQRIYSSDIEKTKVFYEQFYFKSIEDFYCSSLSDFIDTKMVYIANYKFNLDKDKNIKDNRNTLSMGLSRNKFMLFDIYNKMKLKGE